MLSVLIQSLTELRAVIEESHARYHEVQRIYGLPCRQAVPRPWLSVR
jgi:hypothetical protein